MGHDGLRGPSPALQPGTFVSPDFKILLERAASPTWARIFLRGRRRQGVTITPPRSAKHAGPRARPRRRSAQGHRAPQFDLQDPPAPPQNTARAVSSYGYKQTSSRPKSTSALPPASDILDKAGNVSSCKGLSDACRGWATATGSVGRRPPSRRGGNRGGIRRSGAARATYGDLRAAGWLAGVA